MKNISALIKEAKPLYFARKKKRGRIKAALAMLVCLIGVSFMMPQKTTYDIDNEIYQIVNGSVIEDMGLPVDDLGLLLVS